MACNPKRTAGSRKSPTSCVPWSVVMEIGLGMSEGRFRYKGFNWRETPIQASDYIDALNRHMAAWIEGEDIDRDSGLSHITKAITTLVVLRDAMMYGTMIDDRPPKMPDGWLDDLNKCAAAIADKYPEPKPAFLEKQDAD